MSLNAGRNSGRLARCGFTLIELLVVVAIIALLISVLLPTLETARDSAQASACRANLKQFANANAQYVQENDGWAVPGWNDGGKNPQAGWWQNETFRALIFAGNDEQLRQQDEAPRSILCPAAPEVELGGEYSDHEPWRWSEPYAGHWHHVYGQQGYDIRWWDLTNGPAGMCVVKVDAVMAPGETTHFQDGTEWEYGVTRGGGMDEIDPDKRWTWNGDKCVPRPGGTWTVAYRHSRGTSANSTFHDGHVESMDDGDVPVKEGTDPFANDYDHEAIDRIWWVYPEPNVANNPDI